MSTSIEFKIKDTVTSDNQRVVEILFKDWVDDICQNKVGYTISKSNIYDYRVYDFYKTLSVHFEHQEDATVLMLKGLPTEFENYLEMVA